jgi:hypothetical protein
MRVDPSSIRFSFASSERNRRQHVIHGTQPVQREARLHFAIGQLGCRSFDEIEELNARREALANP